MGGLSLWHWLVVLLVLMVLFGRNRISSAMGDIGKGIRSFKQNMAEEESAPAGIDAAQPVPVAAPRPEERTAG